MIKLHNTLTGQKEIFTPREAGKVNMYCCGPTVYDFAHIGNFRSFLMGDLLTRVLEYAGYEVTKVQNITDVGHLTNDDFADADGEDKIAKKAKAEGIDAFAVAEKFTDYFLEDEATLRIKAPNHRPKATDFIQEQIDMAGELIKKDFAYVSNGSVYFRADKFEDYGKLSKNKLEDLQAGARVEVNDEKESPLDFALWKKADANHLMQWDSPWGMGFPGWHIECSAMSQALLPYTDIHTGGEDNIFPHHECEIAQNECSHGYEIKWWLHAKHLLVDGKKMSKSKGNFFTIRDLLEKGWTGPEIRLALLSAHYRTSLNFTEKSLEQARANIERIRELHYRVEKLSPKPSGGEVLVSSVSNFSQKYTENFRRALFDDLNVSDALAVVFDLRNETFKQIEAGNFSAEDASSVAYFLTNSFLEIFDVYESNWILHDDVVPDSEKSEVRAKLRERDLARVAGDWDKADEIKRELEDAYKEMEIIDATTSAVKNEGALSSYRKK